MYKHDFLAGTPKLGLYVLATIAAHVLFSACTLILFLGAPIDVTGVFRDVTIFFMYATAAIQGQVPYRDFTIEYPFLSTPLLVFPRLFASTWKGYAIAFSGEMLCADAIAVYLIARTVAAREGPAQVPRRLMWYTVFFILLNPLVVARFDIVPTVIAMAATLVWSCQCQAAAGVLAGLGSLTKVFPAVTIGPALVSEIIGRKPRFHGVVAFLFTITAGVALWIIIGGQGVARSLQYHLGRGLEIESVYSGLLAVVGRLTHAPMVCRLDHQSMVFESTWSAQVAALSVPIQVFGMLVVLWRFLKSDRTDLWRYTTASVLVFVLTCKVLSPQYLIWPMPFLVVLGGDAGRKARWTFLASCFTTAIMYPWMFFALMHLTPLAVALLNVRNILLLWTLLLLL